MTGIQELWDACTDTVCHFPKDIYTAPWNIDRPCELYGNGSILLCSAEKKCSILASGVVLHDWKIESEMMLPEDVSLLSCQSDTVLDHVVLKGSMDRVGTQTKNEIPMEYDLGQFRASAMNHYSIFLTVSEPCQVFSKVSDLSVQPTQLSTGQNVLTITLASVRAGVTIHGILQILGREIREIQIFGSASETAPVHTAVEVPAPQQKRSKPSLQSVPSGFLPPNDLNHPVSLLQRGQRITVEDTVQTIKLQLAYEGKERSFDIDGYVFLLCASGKVAKEQDLIFWGNSCSEGQSVQLSDLSDRKEQAYFSIQIKKIPAEVQKIVLCYSIYGEDTTTVFQLVRHPYVRVILDDVERNRFPLQHLNQEKTIVAMELYRRNKTWKFNCIGTGYHAGLKRLCEMYGVEVAD